MDGAPRRYRAGRLRAAIALLAFLVLVAIFATPGSGSTFYAVVVVLGTLVGSASIAMLWLLGAIGLGRVAVPLLRPIEDVPSRIALQGVLGAAIALTLAHLLGVLGLMGRWVAWTPTAVGLVVLLHQTLRHAGARAPTPAKESVSLLGALAIPALALLTVAAAIPPGTLWISEGSGYDVLSYHLMLAREWIAMGHIAPLTNNVYSFLPSYVEAAYTQLAIMMGAGGGHEPLGLGSGNAVIAASYLHALMGIGTALVIGVLAHRMIRAHARTGNADADARSPLAARTGAVVAGVTFLSVPWTIVVGSLAYNEMGVTLCFAGALVAALEPSLRPIVRAALAAFLVGVACSVKPTALYLVAPATAIALAASIPPRRWVLAGAVCIPAGLAPLLPWLIRNWLAVGNPIFPAATSIFGPGHLNADQIARWNAEHYLDLSLVGRIARLFDTTHGILHPQWSILFPLAALAAIVAITQSSTRRVAIVATAMLLVQVIAWLAVGHLQSRFLITAAVPATVLVGLATFVLLRSERRPSLIVSYALATASICTLIGSSAFVFVTQNAGAPNAVLIPGVPYMNGSLGPAPPKLGASDAAEFYSQRPASFAVNSLAQVGGMEKATILLVGDAAPLYLGRAPNSIIYATTWDTNPLAVALRESDGDVDAALRALREKHGITHILVNFSELHRLETSGYLDPLLAPSAMFPLVRDHTRVVLRWDDSGVVLVALPVIR